MLTSASNADITLSNTEQISNTLKEKCGAIELRCCHMKIGNFSTEKHSSLNMANSDFKFQYSRNKRKIVFNFWPYIPPQSCIAMKREEFNKIFKKINFNLFPDIWMDFRIGLYLKYIKKDFCVLNQNLTYYRQSQEMISANFKFLSFAWWKRRKQAHNYVRYFFFKNNIRHIKNLDYLLTNLVNYFIR